MKDKKIPNIKQRTILTFSLFSFFIIGFIWLFQALYFNTIYENVKTSEIESISNFAVFAYSKDPNYNQVLRDVSLEKNVEIIIFSVEGEFLNIIFNSSRDCEHTVMESKMNSLMFNINEANKTSYITTNNNIKFLNTGKIENINGVNTYFYVSAPVTPMNSTTQNIQYMLAFISIGVFFITLIGSYVLSSQLSQPIERMAKKAKQLSASNTNVKFNATEYAEVKQLSDTLNFAIGEIKKTDAIRKDVMANVSHELRTPLTMIKSYTELIKDISGNDPEKRQQHLEVIYSEAERLEYLINDMMDYSKLESGMMTYNKTRFNLSESLKLFKTTYSEKYKNFKITLSAPKSAFIYADKTRIEQVISNMLNNAINYSTTKKEINIRLKPLSNENKFRLDIVDHGMGISKENLEHIFDRHFRSSNAKRATVGSGIGLSIAKSILNYHNYQFFANSTEGKGSTFTIIFTGDKGGTNEK